MKWLLYIRIDDYIIVLEENMKKLCEYAENELGIILSDKQISQFEKYYEMLIEKNKVMNLTAITEKDEVVLKHFIDSIALAKYYDFNNNIKVIDVGTGAGFPGIPLKIVFPDINITLYDSLNKRIKFLQEVIDELELDKEGNCEAIHGRAEEGGRMANMRECYDLAVSRAVANMAVLAEYCLPFVKVSGSFIPYKTGKIDEELKEGKKAVSLLGGKIEKTEKLILFDSDIERSFVFIKKIKNTPKSFPRKPGVAKKQAIS